ncbi:sugar ABC transporter substrate-binding protein [Clostridium polyendosporum]|uniref:Sugar ABC transporter substrate-binding protein n=1 Tax=Clostridium polyendosporum TaxID=69208 RepID=A0A919RYN7_9CLOT|nr:sugar ABC transporter substrate-binding protein [Clostridium polyendosporum]GIM28776.1 sugar ABC transporter substrate-binding protein [Clostridium polyendosporum]
MKKKLKKFIAITISSIAIFSTFTGCARKKAEDISSRPVTITYAVWDKNQESAMRAIIDAFEKKNPNIIVKVEVTPWDQYWTKLEAAATIESLPDVFWMHTSYFTKYADGGMLMDLTDKAKDSNDLKWSNFPEPLVDLYAANEKNYGIPKDYDTIALWYNKTMFDKANLSYPDDTWDWNKLLQVAKKLTDTSKGVYGFAAPADAQQGYYNFAYQNGGNIISPDKKKSGYDLKATKEAIQWELDLSQKEKVSPTHQQFTDANFVQMFESGKVAMGLFGSWMVSEFKSNDYIKNNCDVAVIPHGKTRATIYNGLGNVAAAKTKYPEQVWKFMEFLGTEEANTIQALNGAAIPAFKGTEQPWIEFTKEFNLKVYPEMMSYGVIMPNSKTRNKWSQVENEIMVKVWTKELTVEEGCNQLAKKMNDYLASEK